MTLLSPSLLKTMPFGKYKGKTFQEITNKHRAVNYLQWCLDNIENLSSDLKFTIETAINKRAGILN